MNKKGYFLISLFVFSTALCVLIFIRVSGFFISSATVAHTARQAADSVITDTNGADKVFVNSAALAQDLKRKNLFIAPQNETEHPVKNVMGILGDSVLSNGSWYKCGDKIQDAQIIAIEATFVRIKWNGSEKIFTPINSVSAAVQIPQNVEQKQDSSAAANFQRTPQGLYRSTTPAANIENKPKGEDPFAWMGVQLTDSQRQKLNLIWNKLPAEFTDMAKQQWSTMPDEEKKRAIEKIEQTPVEEIERQLNR